jgi:pimeloyl-ACP methyl ester carboxylesterase
MIEYPVFVPFGEDHLAAVVTAPDDARAVALLLQGAGGAPRSHRYRLWTRTARALAARGIGSVRMDYRGIGDSTGPYRFDMEMPPVEEAGTLAELGMRALGADRFGVVGNCIGARTAVLLAAGTDACCTAVCILPLALGPILADRTGRSLARRGLALAARLPPLRHRIRAFGRGGSDSAPIEALGPALQSAHFLFLHGGTPASRDRLQRTVSSAADAVAGDPEAPQLLVRFLPTDGTRGLRPLETQQAVIDWTVDWMDATMPAAPSSTAEPPAVARKTASKQGLTL